MEEENAQIGFDEGLHKEILTIKKLQEHNWDAVVLITGLEGAGKSTLGPLSGRVVDSGFYKPEYALSQTVFSDSQFNNALQTSKPGSCIIWDEAGLGTDTKQVMTKTNMIIENSMQRIRKQRFFIIMIRSVYFDFSKYLAIHRSCALINVYAMRYDDRGYYDFYGREAKKHLYLAGKKTWNMKASQPNWKGRFKNLPVWNDDDYQKKKDLATKEMMKTGTRSSMYEDRYYTRWLLSMRKMVELGMTQTQLADYFGMKKAAITPHMKRLNDLIVAGTLDVNPAKNNHLMQSIAWKTPLQGKGDSIIKKYVINNGNIHPKVRMEVE